MAPRRSKAPKAKRSVKPLEVVAPAPDYDEATPKFCLHHVHAEHCVTELAEKQRADFAVAVQKRCEMTWRDIKLASRHGFGSELIDAGAIKPGIPRAFEDTDKFTVLRYSGKLPMVGVRVQDVFHVLWIERHYGEVYDHD